MTFLYPYFLFSSILVFIPIIIHLFHFRNFKTVYFSNIDFLLQINNEKRSYSKIKHLLVLLSRILVILALVIAFSQPYIPAENTNKLFEQTEICIYIDNSFSMNANSSYGQLSEVAKNKAYEIVTAFPEASKFSLITNDFEKQHASWNNSTQIIKYLGQIQQSPNVKKTSKIIEYAKNLFSDDDKINKQLFLISDFQKSTSDFLNMKADTSLAISMIPIANQQTNNLYIDSCWFESPVHSFNRTDNFFVRIVNFSEENYQKIPLKLSINDEQKTILSFDITANEKKIIPISYTNTQKGFIDGKIEITDYPIIYDNTFYFSYQISEKITVLALSESANKNIQALFEDDTNFEFTSMELKNIQLSQLHSTNCIIIDEISKLSSGLIFELNTFIKNGGTLLLIPAADSDIPSYNRLFDELETNKFVKKTEKTTSINEINTNHLLYKYVFEELKNQTELPALNYYYSIEKQHLKNKEILLQEISGDPILSSSDIEKGRIYTFTIPLSPEENDFSMHPIFVPTIYNIALYSQSSSQLYYTIGLDHSIILEKVKFVSELLKIRKKEQDFDFIPTVIANQQSRSIQIILENQITKADIYYIKDNENPLKNIAFNYDRKESDLSHFTSNEIEAFLNDRSLNNMTLYDNQKQSIVSQIEQQAKGYPLWKYFIFASILFLLLEILLIRFLKA